MSSEYRGQPTVAEVQESIRRLSANGEAVTLDSLQKHLRRHYHKPDGTVACSRFAAYLADLVQEGHITVSEMGRYGAPGAVAPVEVTVVTRRGYRAEGRRQCARCRQKHDPTWRYRDEHGAEVYLCSECKGRVLDWSHGTVDAMRVRTTVVSPFETKTRKH